MQYRLRTLLIAPVWAGLIFLGLRSPTALMTGIVSTVTLVTVLLAGLMATYCTGASRAAAIGYLVFCVGYLVHLVIANWINDGAYTPWTVVFIELSTLIRGSPSSPTMNTGVFNFISIGHNALSCTLGLIGAISAKVIYRKYRSSSNVSPY